MIKKLLAMIERLIFFGEDRERAKWYRDEITQAIGDKNYKRIIRLEKERDRCCGRFCLP